MKSHLMTYLLKKLWGGDVTFLGFHGLMGVNGKNKD